LPGKLVSVYLTHAGLVLFLSDAIHFVTNLIRSTNKRLLKNELLALFLLLVLSQGQQGTATIAAKPGEIAGEVSLDFRDFL
jgi:hypothetical protein